MKELSYEGKPIYIEATGFGAGSGEEYQARVHLGKGPENCRYGYGSTADDAESALRARLAQEKLDQSEQDSGREEVSV